MLTTAAAPPGSNGSGNRSPIGSGRQVPTCFSPPRGSARERREALEREQEAAARKREQEELDAREGFREGCLELEHASGSGGGGLHTLVAHPAKERCVYSAVASVLIKSDVSDPHSQVMFWGHDGAITAVAVSPDGSLAATGQEGSQKRKGHVAPVILWDAEGGDKIFELDGITQRVDHVAFSPDGAILSASGSDGVFYMWDTTTGELLRGQKFSRPVMLMLWGDVVVAGRRPQYELFLCCGTEVVPYSVCFDPVQRQWELRGEPMALPSSGIRSRRHNCCVVQRSRTSNVAYLLCGNDVGEMVIFRLAPSNVYKGSVPVCSAGLLCLIIEPATGAVLCGGGDGVLRKIVGEEMTWAVEQEETYDGGIVSMVVLAGGTEALIETSAGTVYRVLLADITRHTKLTSSHTSTIASVSTGSASDVVATISDCGRTRVWDLGDYSIKVEHVPKARGTKGSCCCWIGGEGNGIAIGYQNGFICCIDPESGNERWSIPSAHRGAVSCLASHVDSTNSTAYLVSGASDGCVRIWSLRTRELILQFSEHRKAVTSVLVDVKHPHIVHSASLDGALFSFDLRKEMRRTAHLIGNGSFTSASQRIDSEQEVITSDAHGKLLFWDCDMKEPVQTIQIPSDLPVACTKVSPSGAFLAVASSNVVHILHLREEFRTVGGGRGHSGTIRDLSWTRDEKQLISVGDDGTMCVWNFFPFF